MSRNYQRQLSMLDTPAGNLNAFKKEGGKIKLYDMGGPSTPEKTTQVTDLPDWAKGYAKDTLSKTAAITDINQNPYKAYGGERIAGFTPMQQQTFQTAADMQPSSQLGTATGLAGAASLGALGTNYQAGRFSGGQFGNRQAAQYMSPYIEEAMQPQLREAQRASDIAGTQQNAQAVQAGAFGGSRQAIMNAERERNLGMQQGDIRAKGYQTAYEQAANQYNQDMSRRMQAQQLGEQSRQYGAGLGMQGLQTALQGAGQLGQLGQTEYGQKVGITELQSKLGAQQQQQAQRPMDMAYQDFINQQNYPYKQLGFMSDMIRGLPLGQQSTSQVYQGSGNTMGQLAGIGMGAYGLSKMGAFAEGGLTYADGGDVTSPQNIEAILAKLSDAQLKQAHEAALNRRDVNEAQMIEAVMAERASMRRGTQEPFSGIAPALPEQFADDMEQSMATGGIVAFADRGVVVDPDELTSSDYQLVRPETKSTFQAIQDYLTPKAALENRQRYEKAKLDAENAAKKTEPKPQAPKNELTPAQIEARNAAIMSGNNVDESGAVTVPQKPAAKPLDKQFADIASAPKPSKAQVKSAVEQLAEQQKLSPDIKDDLMANAMAIRKQLGSENQPIIDEMKKMIEGQKPDVEAMKSQGLNQGLAEFGFKMAANAARPGARFLESASTAAPALSTAAAKTQELITAAQQNYAKLRMDQAKYETALQKNDMQTAATMAAQIRQGQQQDKLLQFHIANAKDQLEMEKQKLASQSAYQQASLSKYETIGGLTRDIMRNEGLPYGDALEKAAKMLKPAGYAADVRAETALATARAKAVEKAQSSTAGTLLAMTDPSNPKYPERKAKFDAEVQRQLDLLTPGAAPKGAVPSANPPRIKLNQNGEIIQ